MAADYLIRRTYQIESLHEGRIGKMDYVIVYNLSTTVGSEKVSQDFTIRLTKDNPTPAEVEAAVQADAKLKAAVLGKHGTV